MFKLKKHFWGIEQVKKQKKSIFVIPKNSKIYCIEGNEKVL